MCRNFCFFSSIRHALGKSKSSFLNFVTNHNQIFHCKTQKLHNVKFISLWITFCLNAKKTSKFRSEMLMKNENDEILKQNFNKTFNILNLFSQNISYASFSGSSIATFKTLNSTNDNIKIKNQKENSKNKQNENAADILSVEQALYCAMEAGIYTKREIQKQIITSPSFSSNRNPFLIENFFSSLDEKTEEEEDIEKTEEETVQDDVEDEFEDLDPEESLTQTHEEKKENFAEKMSLENAKNVIDTAIIQSFNPSCTGYFTHNGLQWLHEAQGVGTRKRAVAHVIIRRGSGMVKVNKDEDLYIRWPYIYNRMDVIQPFYLTKTAGVYDLFISTRGGGPSGQSGATRLAVSRALLQACPDCKHLLEEDLALYEDTRQKMPKMPGRKSARKQKAWSKR